MSFFHNHTAIHYRIEPPIIRHTTSVPFNATSVTVNLAAQAIQENELIIIVIGGLQAVTVTAPAGFIKIALSMGARTSDIWYKLAGASETGSYLFTFSGTLGGHWKDFIITPGSFQYPPVAIINEMGAQGSSPHPITVSPYNITYPGELAICTGNPSSSDTGVTIDNSFGPGPSAHAGSYKVWYRLYNDPATGEVTTVTPTASNVLNRLTTLRPKFLF